MKNFEYLLIFFCEIIPQVELEQYSKLGNLKKGNGTNANNEFSLLSHLGGGKKNLLPDCLLVLFH